MPRKGFYSLPLVIHKSHQKEVLAYFQRFLQVREEAPPSFREHPTIQWLQRRLPAIVIMALLATTLVFVLSACGAGPDPSGLNTANQQNLTSVTANGTTISKQDLAKAQKNEPFAYNLALLVAQIIGMVVCFVYVFGISWIFFALYKRLFGLRFSAQTELKGLDIPEMGGLGYNPDAEFYEPAVAMASSISGGGE